MTITVTQLITSSDITDIVRERGAHILKALNDARDDDGKPYSMREKKDAFQNSLQSLIDDPIDFML